MARITIQKVQETKLSEIFTLYLASAAERGVKDKLSGLTNNTLTLFQRDLIRFIAFSTSM